jgi:hypothetical protein
MFHDPAISLCQKWHEHKEVKTFIAANEVIIFFFWGNVGCWDVFVLDMFPCEVPKVFS